MNADNHVIEAGAGSPLVLLHAFPLNASMWAPQREAFGGVHRVLCPDQRGFGGTPLPTGDEPSVDLLADDVAAMLDARGVDQPVVLGGLSMGGYVAMAFWRRHRERVAALILADTRAGADSPAAVENRLRIAREVVAAGSSAQLVDESLPQLLGSTSHSERPLVRGRVKALVESAPPYAVAWAQQAMASRPDSFQSMRAVDVPTLVLVGEEDALTPTPEAQALADAIPGAQLAVIAKAGHLSSLEAPDEFNAALSSFLGGVLPRPDDLAYDE